MDDTKTPNEQMEDQVTAIRQEFSKLRQMVQEARQFAIHNHDLTNDGEVIACLTLCYRDLQSSGHWTGEVYGALGIRSETTK